MVDLDELWDLVRLFLEQNPDWVHSCGESLCDVASDAFCDFLSAKEVDSVSRWMDVSSLMFKRQKASDGPGYARWIKNVDPTYPMTIQPGWGEHCVAVVCDRWVVDLTARQYGDELPFPFLWELHPDDRLEREGDPREGDRVRSRTYINGAAVPGDEGVVLKAFPGRGIGLVDFRPQSLPSSARATVIFMDREVEVVNRCSR